MSGELGETQPYVWRLMSDIFGDSDEDDDAPPLAPGAPPPERAQEREGGDGTGEGLREEEGLCVSSEEGHSL